MAASDSDEKGGGSGRDRGGRRFRDLSAQRTGDLFEHFHVRESDLPPTSLPDWLARPAVAVVACSGCRWFLPQHETGPCPVCGSGRTSPR